MITFKHGNILEDDAQAIVNPVNCVGVMGAGLALAVKKKFPESFTHYKHACDNGYMDVGGIVVSEQHEGEKDGPRYILHVPTKKHWKDPSKYEWVETGLEAIKQAIRIHQITSVAVPLLGAGLGGLDKDEVVSMIEKELTDAGDIRVYLQEEKPVLH